MDYYHRTPNSNRYFNSFDKFELVSEMLSSLSCWNSSEVVFGGEIKWQDVTGMTKDTDEGSSAIISILLKFPPKLG